VLLFLLEVGARRLDTLSPLWKAMCFSHPRRAGQASDGTGTSQQRYVSFSSPSLHLLRFIPSYFLSLIFLLGFGGGGGTRAMVPGHPGCGLGARCHRPRLLLALQEGVSASPSSPTKVPSSPACLPAPSPSSPSHQDSCHPFVSFCAPTCRSGRAANYSHTRNNIFSQPNKRFQCSSSRLRFAKDLLF
jgi:hypothetical protein